MQKGRKSGRSFFKKMVGVAHLWLGLTSGALIVFLGITGCLLAFETEIRDLTEPFRFVEQQDKAIQPPSVLTAAAEKEMQKPARAIEYPGAGKAVIVSYYNEEEYWLSYVDPYTAEVLKVKDMNSDFFRVVLEGHFYLWLPHEIGKPIVATATLIFGIMLISGIILWWPRNKAARKQRFSFRFNASFKRLNYDLHNVLGFYISWLAIFLVVTGLVWGFEWFSKSFYYVSSGGKALVEEVHPVSDTLMAAKGIINPEDKLYGELKARTLPTESFSIYLPASSTDPIEGAINHRPGTYYKTDYYHYDQYTLKEMPTAGTYGTSYSKSSFGDKVRRMNYDVHVGAILGLPGKILAFATSLLASSLPVTGFLIWRGRRRKKKAAVAGPTLTRVPSALAYN